MSFAPASLHQTLTPPEDILAKLFQPTGVDGVHSRTGAYEDVVDGLGRYINTLRPVGAEVFRFPPVVSRKLIEKSGYLKSFPNLLGCVCALSGDEAHIEGAVDRFLEGGESWTADVEATDLLLAPAACYPIYEIAERRGTPPAAGFLYDVAGDCFRREPSRAIDRLQSFRMREFVAIGAPETIRAFRQHWIERAPEIAGALGLAHRIETASDPFFGRAGAMVQTLSGRQRAQVRDAHSRALDRRADRVHELQLSPRAFWRDLGDQDGGWRARSHRLRRLWNRPPRRRAVRGPWDRYSERGRRR